MPLPQSSLTIIVNLAPTTSSEVSVTGERGKTILSVLSNISDEDLSVVDGDVSWSQR